MRDRKQTSRLRQEIRRLMAEAIRIGEGLLHPRRMIAASLVERHLGTTEEKRRSSAFYLSWAEGGRTRLRYVPKERVEEVRAQTEAWRAYRREVRRFRGVVNELVERFGELGEWACEEREGVDGE